MNFTEELKRRNVFRVGVAYGVAAWVVLQIADLVLEAIEAPGWVIKALLLVVALGFAVALVISWAYELTPDGIKKEADVDRSQSVVGDTGKKLDKIIIGFLIVAVSVLLIERSMGPESQPQISELPPPVPHIIESPRAELEVTQTSVAVLPFANMSADADNEYFSDGISEELLNLLVRIDGLRVPSRTSSFAFKGMNIDIKEIAQQLEVGHILEGSVRKAGNRVRVTAQLIEVTTDTHIWSETYDRELEDIFAIQDEIASNIVEALKLALGTTVEDHKPTENLSAYEDFLRGRHLFMQRGVDSLTASLSALQDAIQKDPEFVEAWAQICQTAATLSGWDPDNAKITDAIAIEAGMKALSINPDSANAMAGLGLAYQQLGRWVEAIDMVERAEPLAKDSTPIYWLGLILHTAGYLDEARTKLLKAEQIDPFYPQLQYWLGVSDLSQNDVGEARIRFQRAVDGNNPNGYTALFDLSILENKFDAAARWMDEIRNLREASSISGRFDENDQILRDALLDPGQQEAGLQAAIGVEIWSYLAKFGAYDEILKVNLEKISQGLQAEVRQDLGTEFWSSHFSPMRQKPEFKTVLRELGLVELWKTRGWPDLCQPVGNDDFACN